MFISDPTPYLFVSFEMKKEDSLKPYDAKKSVWVPNKEDGGFDEGLIQVPFKSRSKSPFVQMIGREFPCRLCML